MAAPRTGGDMCLICVEFQKNKMTAGEARNAFREMVVGMDPAHAEEVRNMLRDAEQKQNPPAPSVPSTAPPPRRS